MAITVVLADDHAIVRQGLGAVISQEQDIKVIAEASNGKEAVGLAVDLHPQLIIMDINMPEMDGIRACEVIKQKDSGIKVVLYTMYDPKTYGADGRTRADMCLSKDRLYEEMPGVLKGFRT